MYWCKVFPLLLFAFDTIILICAMLFRIAYYLETIMEKRKIILIGEEQVETKITCKC